MQKFKAIKILFIFLAFNVMLSKHPLLSTIGPIICIYLLNFKDINNKIKSFKTKYLKYILISIPLVLINYLLLLITSKISPLPENETLIRSLIKLNPLYYTLIFGILSPIGEELTFRYGFDNIKNKYIYMILPSLLYAFMHLSSMNEILYIIPYFILGLTFAFTYKKTNSLIYPITIHIINNLISILLILL